MFPDEQTFGSFIREQRIAKNLSLRQMAKLIDVSPTYLSRIENEELQPPSEETVGRIAAVIGCKTDTLMAQANRLPSELERIIKAKIRENPEVFTDFYRSTATASADVALKVTEQMKGSEAIEEE